MSRHPRVVMNSKMPSDATMSTLSFGLIWWWSSSGSAITPNDSARLSPMDRVKAVPGYSWSWALGPDPRRVAAVVDLVAQGAVPVPTRRHLRA